MLRQAAFGAKFQQLLQIFFAESQYELLLVVIAQFSQIVDGLRLQEYANQKGCEMVR